MCNKANIIAKARIMFKLFVMAACICKTIKFIELHHIQFILPFYTLLNGIVAPMCCLLSFPLIPPRFYSSWKTLGKLGTSWKLQGATMNQMCTKVLLYFSSFIKYWCKSISINMNSIIMEKYEPSWTPQMVVFVFTLINQPISVLYYFLSIHQKCPHLLSTSILFFDRNQLDKYARFMTILFSPSALTVLIPENEDFTLKNFCSV